VKIIRSDSKTDLKNLEFQSGSSMTRRGVMRRRVNQRMAESSYSSCPARSFSMIRLEWAGASHLPINGLFSGGEGNNILVSVIKQVPLIS
jgi:hypothetical protein